MPFRLTFRTLKTQWQRLTIRDRGIIVLAIPLICAIVSVFATSWLRQNVIQAEKYVDRTQDVLLISEKVLVSLLNAETGVRGYYLTHQAIFLKPYKLALTNLPTLLDRMKYLVQDNPSQLQRANEISQLARENIILRQKGVQYIEGTIPTNDPDKSLNINILMTQGKQKMDRAREAIGQFEEEERRLLVDRKQVLAHQWELNLSIVWSSLFIGVFGTAIAVRLFSGLVQDLIQREKLLCESRNLTQAIVANVVDSVVILDLENRIKSFNNSAVQMFGYAIEEVSEQDWRILLPDAPEIANEIPTLSQAEATQVTPWQTMGQRKHGEHFPVEITISEISFNRRRILIIRDITERQQTAAKLEARADELDRLNASLSMTNQVLAERNRELDQFAYVTSHDLKAPLRAIANLSAWIEEDLEGQLSNENLKQMKLLRSRVYRMEGLLNGLLEYSRVGRVATQAESVDVGALLVEIVGTLSPPPTFKIVISTDMPILTTRSMLLKQVFTNLIENAIKHHTSESGLVNVSAIDLGDRYEFSVTDDGKGIDPKFHDKIYAVFQTLEARDAKESTGIGLSIVKKIVETEGGTICLESQIGAGTTFRFTWLKSPIGESSNLVRKK